ncbi:preprotein translocase subunit SecA [Candidatus Pelagibacter sp.]|nr:preprotein translocase subunit SecA [Candidatus Pelagibacter sp.]
MLNPLNLISKIFKSSNQKKLDNYTKIVEKINNLEEDVAKLDESLFPKKTKELKEKLSSGSSLNDLLPLGFSLVREASRRVNNERHFDVQLVGGIALNNNKIAEMKTGEGKTLTIALAAYLNALDGNGVHVITVNDYLAKRDAENMGKIYNFLGLSCGYINSGQTDEERRKSYACDITYATNSELGFDYLRDNMKFSKSDMVQRGHNYAIVDEIDSCLIDEARVPLIISGQAENKTDQYIIVNKLIKKLEKEDFDIDEKNRNILLTNKGIDNVEKIFSDVGILKNNNFYDPQNLSLVHLVNQSLRANHIFLNGRDYIIKDNEIVIIDEQSGRQMPGRRFGDGLHQSLEAKENLKIQFENQTLASITYQNYFKLYNKLCGCTGTAQTEAQEFFEIYNLNVITIPTNKKMIRQDLNDQIYRTEKEKDDAIVELVLKTFNLGQPILVFTSSINKSEHYSKLFNQKQINHVVLNAKNHDKEAEIIANAGSEKSVIITTSISGRGVDIKLGGKNADNDSRKHIKNKGGLLVIGTERMESRRVDNQARGRAGRQGDEGKSIFFVSLEDDLMRIFGSESMNNILQKLGLKDGESIDHPWINKALERAQQKVEARNFDIRKSLLKFDDVLNDQRHVIFSQRRKVMDSENPYDFADKFLNQIMSELNDIKNKNIDFEKTLLSFTGTAFNKEELDKLKSKDSAYLNSEISKKFKEKREERVSTLNEKQSKELEKRIFLQLIDQNWKMHIQYLEQLRQVIGLRSYGQRDPLIEYKKEAFNLFENLLDKLKNQLVGLLLNLKIVDNPSKNIDHKSQNKEEKIKKLATGKIGRNEQCPCNSGKKFKNCCGAL